MTVKQKKYLSWVLALCMMVVQAYGEVLTSLSATDYVIVTHPQATDTEQFAAAELNHFLSFITQTPFRQVNQPQGKYILVSSYKALSDEEKEGLSEYSFAPESYLILQDSISIRLIGGSPPATLYAVYAFLQDLGCRWVAPDYHFYAGTNQYLPIWIKSQWDKPAVFETPAFRYRKLYVEEGRTHTLQSLLQLIDWMPKVKLNTLVFPMNYEGRNEVSWEKWRKDLTPELQKRGITIEVGGHGYQNFLNATMQGGKLFATHPEWFGKDAEGKRTTDYRRVFCTSNTAAVEYFVKEVISYLKSHPEIAIFDCWAPDSEQWCTCASCEALGNPSDRQAILLNQVYEVVSKELPDVKLQSIAYGKTAKASEKHLWNKNILMEFCPIRQNFEHQIDDGANEQNQSYWTTLSEWRQAFQGQLGVYSYYRKYAWRSLPNILTHYMQKDIQAYQQLGIDGVSVYSEPGDWFTYGINHYVFAHLLWNTEVSVDSLMNDYCRVVYNKASYDMLKTYTALEDIVRFACNVAHSSLKTEEEYVSYLQQIADLKENIQGSQALFTTTYTDSLYTQNVKRMGWMLDYASKSIRYMIAKSTKRQEEMAAIDLEIRAYLREFRNEGIFIPHRQ
ncbi:MAG: hypothetical protein BGO29_00710 [Bacteroidales bacterium 36-12]|nr:MAG: hypothetical protein BGO29_00710 [Bacteroidales bacterium 36-12]